MFTKTLHVMFVAGVVIAGSGMIAASAGTERVTTAAAKAPHPYRLDGFHGWASGYPIADTSCRPTASRKLDTCGPSPRAASPRVSEEI